MSKKLENEKDERAINQAKSQLKLIIEMVKNLNMPCVLDTDNEEIRESALNTIMEDPLTIQVRTDWYTPGEEPEEVEYNILLCTGGPAVRIIGDLNQHKEPETARLQYQDWFTEWTDLDISAMEEEALLVYARCFYFGE